MKRTSPAKTAEYFEAISWKLLTAKSMLNFTHKVQWLICSEARVFFNIYSQFSTSGSDCQIKVE